jgi:hypothetical protein
MENSKMKLYLASFFEPDNHGPGRKISIATNVPEDIDVDATFDMFVPLGMGEYYRDRYKVKNAGEKFVGSYKKQLDDMYSELSVDAAKEGKSMMEVLPFKDGDTLLSWEHAGNLSYRGILNDYLKKVGYETELR